MGFGELELGHFVLAMERRSMDSAAWDRKQFSISWWVYVYNVPLNYWFCFRFVDLVMKFAWLEKVDRSKRTLDLLESNFGVSGEDILAMLLEAVKGKEFEDS